MNISVIWIDCVAQQWRASYCWRLYIFVSSFLLCLSVSDTLVLCLFLLFALAFHTHTKNSLQNGVYLPEIMQSSLNMLYSLFLSSLQRFISKWIHRLDQWTRKLGLVLFEESSGYGHVHGAQDQMNVIVMIIRSIWKFHEAV